MKNVILLHLYQKDFTIHRHVALEIRPDISTEEFVDLLSNNQSSPKQVGEENKENKQVDSHKNKEKNSPHCVLVGLHTCGDLASTMLKVGTFRISYVSYSWNKCLVCLYKTFG